MPSWEKVDRSLQEIYANYDLIKTEGIDEVGWIDPHLPEDGQPIAIVISYTGASLSVASPGFTIEQDNEDGSAYATVILDDLEALTDSAQILEIRFGDEPTLHLDTSVIEILARKAASGSAPFQWEVDRSNGNFTGKTGENVIVGIIDTGIDYTHINFLKDATPTTRILRIWDQGLIPQAGESSPDKALLAGPKTYGVEYTDAMINDVLQKKAGAKPIRHKDCVGHGSHVASTAAGDGRQAAFSTAKPYDFVGVAPKAWIIMVKALELTDNPASSTVSTEVRMRDAYMYIKKVAKSAGMPVANMPVVINSSFGKSLGPHDGLGDEEIFITKFFDTANKGLAGIFSAGNSSGKRLNAVITIPLTGSIEFPLEMTDKRRLTTSFDTCKTESNTEPALLDFWYSVIAPKQLSVSVKTPNSTAVLAGSKLNGKPSTVRFDKKKRSIIFVHRSVASTLPVITRNNLSLALTASGDVHRSGTYLITLTAPPGTIVHAWSRRSNRQGFSFPSTVPAGVNVIDDSTINGSCCSPNVTTVAAYDDLNDKIADFSSRGPLLDFTGSGPLAAKPDLAAPGVSITAAQSASVVLDLDLIRNIVGSWYISFQGTSMSAPHITGAAALILQKNATLSSPEVQNKLTSNVRTPPTPELNAFGAGIVDVKKTVDAS
jgi:subtilisin family serine protease